ncbi:MAG TPA: ABC transporter permease [Bryobacteraceae bacterium]|nr:ABC transporter permease [Bryobacteraceae bacterium]
MHSIAQDIKFGARILLRSPGITLAVILALALGIGANSAMFSIVDALLLHPVRFRDPASLVLLWDRDAQGVVRFASSAEYLDWRKSAKSFSDLAAWRAASFVADGGDRPEQITGAQVTANYFRTLGVTPLLGRTFLPDEDGIDNPASASKVAVISYRLWQENFGADPNILGRTVRLNSIPYAIIGVLPADFQFIWRTHQVWIPIALDPGNRDYHYVMALARLKASRDSAAAEMSGIARSLGEQYPRSNKDWTVQVDDFRDWLISRSLQAKNANGRARLLLLVGAVALILLIACANIATLLLARAAARNREIALRLSLGATRGRLARQLLTEALLLSLAGGAAGLALAWTLIRASPSILPPDMLPGAVPIGLNQLVIIYTVAIAVATGVLFGLAPALTATRPDVQETLKDSARGTTSGRGRQRLRQLLVTAEIGLALILVSSAGLMIESLRRMYTIDLGFDPKNVLTLRVFLPAAKYDAGRALRFHREALARIAALPGVETVAAASNLPLQQYTMEVPFDLETAPPRDEGERPGAGYISITPDFLRALRVPVKRGRAFTGRDDASSPPVAIVNQAFADRYFPNDNPVGKRLVLNRPVLGKNGFEDAIRPEIVGVIGNLKEADLGGGADPIIYVPHEQNVWNPVTWFTVRTRINPAGLADAVRRELMQIDKEQPIDQVGTMQQTFETRFAEPRFQMQVMSGFALLALILAVVGIYGVNSYAVTQRRHEIGVRMALGATPGAVLREVLAQGMRLAAIGIVLGLLGATAAASALRSVLVGVSATDPLTLAAVSFLLAFVTAIACYIPARRATRIDPAIALRDQ